MKLDQLLKFKPLGFIDSPVGKLAVFGSSVKDMETVRGKSVKDITPQEVVRRLLPRILHKDDALKEDGTRPDAPTLTDEQLSGLSAEVVEAALEFFIEHNEHLYRPFVSKGITNEKGERVTSLEFGDVQYPKKDGESNVEYLHRLLVLDEEEMKRQMEKLAGPLLGAAHFSDKLSQSIKSNLLMGDTINPGVLSRACKAGEITTNQQSGRGAMVEVKSFIAWLGKKRELPKDELDQVRNAIIGEISARK